MGNRVLLIILLLHGFVTAKTQTAIWSADRDSIDISNKVSFLKDETNQLGIYQVSSGIYNMRFTPSKQSVIHFGYTANAYWLKFSLQNNTKQDLYLVLEQALIPNADLYFKDSAGGWEILKSGYAIDMDRKIVKDNYQVFPLPAGIREFYLRLIPYAHPIPVKIWSKNAYELNVTRRKLIYGFYVGILSFAIIINLFLFAGLRKIYYLQYALLVFLYICSSAFVMEGYAVYLFPRIDLMYWYKIIPVLDMPVLLTYCITFLELKKYSAKLYRVTVIICIYILAYLIWLHFLPLLSVLIINQIYALFVFLLAISIGVTVGKRSNKLGYYFAIAYSIWFVLIAADEMYIQFGVPRHFFELSYVSIAIFIEAFLLAYLLAKRFQWEREDSVKIQFEMQAKINLIQQQFKQEILQSQLETQEHSFNLISQELHDNIGQLLSSTKLLLSVAGKDLKNSSDIITSAEQTIGEAITGLRSLSKALNKEWLHQFNLIENLKTERNRLNTAQVQLELITDYNDLPLEADAQVMLFRVVQEALQNCIKHASATHITIQIKNKDQYFILSIEDDGIGFNVELSKNESLGLRNMEYRVRLLKGKIEWKSIETKGTTVTIYIPIERYT
jgi:signal transduction histidine kinase